MEKLKKIFSNISNSIKSVYKKFPVTIIIVYLVTLFFTLGTDEFIREFEREGWLALFAIWAVGAIFVETWCTKKINKGIGVSVTLIIAAIFRYLERLNIENDELLMRVLITYISLLSLFTIYKFIKKSEIEVKEYALNVISNFGKSTIIYALANIGVLFVLWVFIELILDGYDYDLIEKALIILFGGYYVPALINVLTDMSAKPTKFLKVLIVYVLSPIVSFLIAILYMYLVKITLSGELLHNSIFAILSMTFAGTIPISILLSNYDENSKIKKWSRLLVYLFMPFIILQIVAIGIRISDYGLTESRYMACVLIIFEIAFISLLLIKKSEHLDKSLWVVAALVVIGILSPLNVEAATEMSQTARIEKILSKAGSFEELTENEKIECKEAFVFLKRYTDSEYVIEKIGKDTLDKIEEYKVKDTNKEYYEDYNYIYAYEKTNGIDISEYSKMYQLSEYYAGSKEKDYKNYPIKDGNNEILTEANITEFINKMMKADMNGNEDIVFEKNRIIETDDENIVVYLTNFSMRYEVYTKEVNSIDLEGYILVK